MTSLSCQTNIKEAQEQRPEREHREIEYLTTRTKSNPAVLVQSDRLTGLLSVRSFSTYLSGFLPPHQNMLGNLNFP